MERCAALLALLLAACAGRGHDDAVAIDAGPDAAPAHRIDTVFVILMENKNWAAPSPDPVLVGNPSAPYLNGSLLPIAAHADDYRNPSGGHPSPVDYVWLEAGDALGIDSDRDPSPDNSIASGPHLVDLLEAAGISWRAYVEDIPGGDCPLASHERYAARHVPFLFFQDVTEGNRDDAARCIAHVVPYPQLASDLAANQQARYDVVIPSLCDDMHGADACPADHVASGDVWLAGAIPMIMGAPVYQRGHAAILVIWDESVNGEYPIGLLAISPDARAGYGSPVALTHSSTLRTLEEIFDVGPWLGDAANATSLADLFTRYP